MVVASMKDVSLPTPMPLSPLPARHDAGLTLEQLQVEGAQGGTVFMAGRCCAGWAVPCHHAGCTSAFEPEGPGIFNSAVSIMLVICAIVHTLSAVER
jgi:hypothetical protein